MLFTGDRRGVFVALTPVGATKFESALEKHWRDIDAIFAQRLTTKQHEAVADALWSFWHDDEGDADEA